MYEKAVILEERVAQSSTIMLSFTGDKGAYCAYTKSIDFLFLMWYFTKPKASGLSLGSGGLDFDLNIWESGRKVGYFGGSRSTLPLLLC